MRLLAQRTQVVRRRGMVVCIPDDCVRHRHRIKAEVRRPTQHNRGNLRHARGQAKHGLWHTNDLAEPRVPLYIFHGVPLARVGFQHATNQIPNLKLLNDNTKKGA